MKPNVFRAFCDLAYEQAGIKLGEEKLALVSARVGKRLRALNLTSEVDYLEVLRTDDGGELIEFLDVISTNFTSFFREPAHFDRLAQDLGARLAQGQKSFRLWCAASSSGEEPYTIALVLDQLFAGHERSRPGGTAGQPGSQRSGELAKASDQRGGVDWKVLATDISTKVLGMAKRGQYRAQQLKAVQRDALARSFVKLRGDASGDDVIYEAGHELKSHLTFARLNLARPPFPMRGPFDAVSRSRTEARPLVGGTTPRRILINVLLPAPLAPTRPMMPDSTLRSSISRALTWP